ncbi:MAG: carboxymuconolactone decarboxylase family protein [Alphaproteobacteria bacterium]
MLLKKYVAIFTSMFAFSQGGIAGANVQTQKLDSLEDKEKSIALIASYGATGSIEPLKDAIKQGLDNELSINQIKEVLVQLYAYAGFPRSLNALGVLMEVSKQNPEAKMGKEGKALPADTDKWAYGNNVQIELTGSEVKGGLMDFSPAIDTFLKEHLFADIFGRDVLSYKEREIATLAILASIDGLQSQLQSHVNISKHIGIDEAKINDIITLAKEQSFDSIFPKGEINPYGEFFTGITYLTMLSDDSDMFNEPIGHVTFEPLARTHWHKHSGGQILLVTGGEGRYQPRGGKVQILHKGDVVRIEPNIEHWHGAAPNSWFAHIATTPNAALGNQVTWLEAVSDEQYH